MSELSNRAPELGIRLDVHVDGPFVRPAEPVQIVVEIYCSGVADLSGVRGELVVSVLAPWRDPVTVQQQILLTGGISTHEMPPIHLAVPSGSYQLHALLTIAGRSASAVGGFDVLADWRDDPRYGFLCEFSQHDGDVEARVRAMGRYHVTCVQLYDWMFRHYKLIPTTPEYADIIGKKLSFPMVQAAVDAAHAAGMAALAYATVYAAELEFTDEHRDWQLYDDVGTPAHLADMFYLMDVEPEGGWTKHMVAELADVLSQLPVDGFHLDQYGYPRVARTQAGLSRDVGVGLAAVVRAADGLVAAERPGGGSIFNNVNGWPLELTAADAPVANYIEVWRPHTDYRSLVSLIDRARALAPRTPVILAAYPSFLRTSENIDLGAGGVAAMTAVILAAGAWPLLVGEGDRILTDPYYPKHLALGPRQKSELCRVLDAGVAWRDLLRNKDARLVDVTFIDGPDAEIALDVPFSSQPIAGAVWVRMVSLPGWTVLSLVNLIGVVDPEWDHEQRLAESITVRLTLPAGVDHSEYWTSTTEVPWTKVAVETLLPSGPKTVALKLRLWTIVAVRAGKHER